MVASKKADVPSNLIWIILIIVVAIVAALVIATIVVPGIQKGGNILDIFSSTAKEQASGAGILLPLGLWNKLKRK